MVKRTSTIQTKKLKDIMTNASIKYLPAVLFDDTVKMAMATQPSRDTLSRQANTRT